MFSGKKLFALFVVLGLVGFFLISSKSFAYSYLITQEDCDTIIDYYYPSNTKQLDSIKTYFKAQMESVQANYDIVFFGVSDISHPTYRLIGLDYNQITSINNLNDTFYMSVTFTGTCYFRSCMGNGAWYDPTWTSISYSNTTLLINTGAQQNGLYLMYNNDIPNVTDGPYQSENVLNLTPPYVFDIDIKTNSDTEYFSITTEFNNTINDIPVIYSNDFGYFYDNTYKTLINDNLQFWYYNGTTWVSKQIFNRSNQSWVLVPSNSYIDISYDSSLNNELAYLILNDIISYNNVVFEYTINNVDLDAARCFFLIGTENTIVNNGVIDTSSFGSDYLNQFQNLNQIINDNNNTEAIIDNENKNNDFWKNTYDNLFSMDSGDVNDIYNTIQPYISSGDSPIGFYNMLFDSLSDDPQDFVISWNNIPVRLTLFNGQELFSGDFIAANSINFSEACRENVVLSTLLNWVRIFNVLFFITSYLYTIYTCILVILGISLTFVDPPEPEHRQIGFINDWRDR